MEEFDIFAQILKKSAEKHGGDKPITLGHLANIANLAITIRANKEIKMQEAMDQAVTEFWSYGNPYGD